MCSIHFHNFRQVEAANEFADFLISLHAQGPMQKKMDHKIFLERLMYQSIPTLTIPLRQHPGISTFSLLGESGFCPTFFAGGGGGSIREIFCSFEINAETSPFPS